MSYLVIPLVASLAAPGTGKRRGREIRVEAGKLARLAALFIDDVDAGFEIGSPADRNCHGSSSLSA